MIQHSAGSGKSNSIAWLAHQLIGLTHVVPSLRDGDSESRRDSATCSEPVFDSIIVITDRRILDQQIRDTIKQFAQVGATVGHAEHSGDLRKFIAGGKKIIISTVQKFPFILDEIGMRLGAQDIGDLLDGPASRVQVPDDRQAATDLGLPIAGDPLGDLTPISLLGGRRAPLAKVDMLAVENDKALPDACLRSFGTRLDRRGTCGFPRFQPRKRVVIPFCDASIRPWESRTAEPRQVS